MQNESRRAGLLRLSHLREVTEAKAEDMEDMRPRFQALRNKQPSKVVSSFNLFQTPQELARLAVEIANPSGRILEPSAGLGRLYDAIREKTTDHVTLCEISSACCEHLYQITERDNQTTLRQGDFLSMDLGDFDCVVMNPPFKQGRDIRHIEHALTMLAPGGVLVSFCFWGVRQQKRFAGEDVRILPADSFKSEGTRAQVAIVTIRK